MDVFHRSGIFSLYPTIFQIFFAGVTFHAFYICMDGERFRGISIYVQNTYQNVFPYLESLPGITQPVKRQISCKDGSFYTKDFCPDYFFSNGNDPGLYNTVFMDFSLPGRVLIKIENLTFFQHSIFPAGNDASGFGIQTFDNEINFAAKHIIQNLILAEGNVTVVMGFILDQIDHHFRDRDDSPVILIVNNCY